MRTHDGWVFRKVTHRLFDPAKQLTRPHDVAADRRRVSTDRRRVLVLLVRLLHRLQVRAVVFEDQKRLVREVLLQRVSVDDRFKLRE